MSKKTIPYTKHNIEWQGALIKHLERDRSKKDEPGLLADLPPYALRLYLLIQIRVAALEKIDVEISNADAQQFAKLDGDTLSESRRVLRRAGLVDSAPIGDSERPRVYSYRVLDPNKPRASWDGEKAGKNRSI